MSNSEKKGIPYVGVTGFISRAEVEEAFAVIPFRMKRRLMVGVLMSSKTLAGQQNKWPVRYPKMGSIGNIFITDSRDDEYVLNLIHHNTDHPKKLCQELIWATGYGGPRLDGFQLNIAWPEISQIESYTKVHPEKFLILQLGGHALAIESPKSLAERVGNYLPMIDSVLINSSGGKGEPLDAVKGTRYLRVLRDKYPTLGLGIAGGLGPYTLHVLDSLIREFPDLSIDAEGRLRTPTDSLSLEAMRMYLEDAFPILAGKELPGTQLTMAYGNSYGLDQQVHKCGSGSNMLRTSRFAQPRALQTGDTLASGDRILSPPREGGNGSVLVRLTGGADGHWISMPARIPVALLTKEDNAPAELLSTVDTTK